MQSKIAVLGAGTMGAGIAQVAAQSGYDVLLYDIKEEYTRRGLENISKPLQARADKGKMEPSEVAAVLERIHATVRREDASSCDVIIEAVPEDLEMKREIFASLSSQASVDAILLTNTSSLSVTSIASASVRPERVAGMHFFNPAPVMALVEVVAGHHTLPEVVQTVADLATSMGKSPVRSADTPGFIVNRVARPFYGEALKMLGEGTASVPQIDAAIRAAGFRMGPFELMDMIGIDVNFAVTKSLYGAYFGESRYRPHPIQQRMVEAGTYGRKSGRGFYSYHDGDKGDATLAQIVNTPHKRAGLFIPQELTATFVDRGEITPDGGDEMQAELIVRILSMIMNEAAFAVGEGVASARDINTAMKLGTNYPKGPLKWADHVGLDLLVAVLNSLRESLGEERYRPAPLLRQMVQAGIIGDAVGEGFHTPGEKGMV